MKHGGNMRTRNGTAKRDGGSEGNGDGDGDGECECERQLEIFVPNPNLIVTQTNCSACRRCRLSPATCPLPPLPTPLPMLVAGLQVAVLGVRFGVFAYLCAYFFSSVGSTITHCHSSARHANLWCVPKQLLLCFSTFA